jgi:hypothetical protein
LTEAWKLFLEDMRVQNSFVVVPGAQATEKEKKVGSYAVM